MMALQVRGLQELPTYALFVDLLQGYDVSWRDGIRLGLHQAGITGGLFLYKDDQLEHDLIQTRLGSFVGPQRVVAEGVMQGRRTATHEFNALIAT